jgi:hypothetical protein
MTTDRIATPIGTAIDVTEPSATNRMRIANARPMSSEYCEMPGGAGVDDLTAEVDDETGVLRWRRGGLELLEHLLGLVERLLLGRVLHGRVSVGPRVGPRLRNFAA